MTQDRLTTTQRGLGWDHQQAAARLRAEHIEGTPCPRCGQPMYSWQKLDAGHSLDRAVYGRHILPDRLEHSRCNRKAGAILGARLRRRTTMQPVTVAADVTTL